jgi:molybdate transport system substrate-binding protein
LNRFETTAYGNQRLLACSVLLWDFVWMLLQEVDVRPMRRASRTTALIVVCLLGLQRSAEAQTLAIAAASDLQAALPAIAAQFEKDTGQKVTLTFGSSGNFFAQIRNGAPFDVFLSADIDYPRQLERAGAAERGSLYAYATGRLVLWTRKDSGIDVRGGLSVLADGRVRRVAIANPEHAPYGRAAVAALRHEGLYEQVKGKFVLGENISQTAQFAQSGNATVGLLALSLALAPALEGAGTYVEIPADFHPPIEQAAVVVAASRQKALAQQFVDALKKPSVAQILQSYGFGVPRADR